MILGGGVLQTTKIVVAQLKNESGPRTFIITERIEEMSISFAAGGSIESRSVSVNGENKIFQSRKGFIFGKSFKELRTAKKIGVDINLGIEIKVKQEFSNEKL